MMYIAVLKKVCVCVCVCFVCCVCVCRVEQESELHGHVFLFLHALVLLWWQRIRLHHAWLSAFAPAADQAVQITRPQRLVRACVRLLSREALVATGVTLPCASLRGFALL